MSLPRLAMAAVLGVCLSLCLSLPQTARAQTPADDQALKEMIDWWQQKHGTVRATTDGTIAKNVGDLIILDPKTTDPIAWDVPEELARKGEYYEDSAGRIIVLPSAHPGTYRVKAWTSKRTITVLPLPFAGTLPIGGSIGVAEGRPTLLKTYVIEIKGGKETGKETAPEVKKTTTTPLVGGLAETLAADIKTDPSNADVARSVAPKFCSLADRLEKNDPALKYVVNVRDAVTALLKEIPSGKLPLTQKAIVKHMQDAPPYSFGNFVPAHYPNVRTPFIKALREVCNALK